MSRKKKSDERSSESTAETEATPAAESPAPDAGPQAAETAARTEAAAPSGAEEELAALRDENLRLVAELRNLRQRAQREKEEALKYAEADFARDLLVVLDDLERTLESARAAGNAQALAEGVRIVYEHFLKVFRSRQIEPIAAVGCKFDPDLHEAVMQQPSTEHPAGVVVQELARGYRMRGRVIRPAKVIVSSGPTAEPEPTASTEAKGDENADV